MYHGWCGGVRAGGRLPSELIIRARSAEVWDGGHRHACIIIHRRHAAALWEACSHETVWALRYHTQRLLMLLTRWVSPRRYTHTNYNHINHNHCTEAACEISRPTKMRFMSGLFENFIIRKNSNVIVSAKPRGQKTTGTALWWQQYCKNILRASLNWGDHVETYLLKMYWYQGRDTSLAWKQRVEDLKYRQLSSFVDFAKLNW